jgi:hypothetical protein
MRPSTFLVPAALLLSTPVLAQEAATPPPASETKEPAPTAKPPPATNPAPPPSWTRPQEDEWAHGARFFVGARTGVAIPPNSTGVAPMLGLELGVSAQKGLGFGLHLLGMGNPPEVPAFGIPKAKWGLGALADVRMYFQSIEPLKLYATLSAGFLAGPGAEGTPQAGRNVVLPLLNPGFGARVRLTDTVYTAFEFGLAGFQIPFIALSFGMEPPRKDAAASIVSAL